jgi:hypothetical protein
MCQYSFQITRKTRESVRSQWPTECVTLAVSDVKTGTPLTAAIGIRGTPQRTHDWGSREGYPVGKPG